MPLQPHEVDIPLGEGIAEGVGAKLLDAPKIAELIDARWDKRGEYAKRYGSVEIADTGLTSGATPHTALEHQGALLQQTSEGMHRWDDAAGAWVRAHVIHPRPSLIKTDPIARGNGSFTTADIAYSSGHDLACIAFRDDADGIVRVTFVQASTGVVLASSKPAPTNIVDRPRVVFFNSRFVLFGIDSSGNENIYAAVYNPTAFTYAFGTAVLIHSGNAADVGFDVHAASGQTTCHLAIARGASGWKAYKVDTTPATIASRSELVGREAFCIAVLHNPTLSRVYVLFDDASPTPDQLSIDYMPDSYGVAATKTKVLDYESNGALTERRCTLEIKDTVSGALWCFVSHGRSDGKKIGGVEFVTVSATGAPTLAKKFVPGITLATQAIRDVHGRVVLGVSREILFDDGTAIGFDEPLPCGMVVAPVNISEQEGDSLCEIGRFGHDAIQVRGTRQPNDYIGSLVDVEGELWAAYKVVVAKNTGSTSYAASAAQLLEEGWQWGIDLLRCEVDGLALEQASAESLALHGGGTLTCFDGVRCSELAIPFVPHWIDYYDSAITAAIAGNGAYTFPTAFTPPGGTNYNTAVIHYRYLFRWVDSEGNIHRSSLSTPRPREYHMLFPSPTADAGGPYGARIPYGVALSGDVNQRVIVFPKPSITAQNGELGVSLKVELYRTGPNIHHWDEVPAGTDILLGTTQLGLQGAAYALVGVLPIGTVTGHPNLGWVEDPMSGTFTEPLASAPAPYTDLGSEPIGPVLDVCSTQQRLFAIDGEDRLAVPFSKPFSKGYAPEFNAALRIRCAAEGGDLVACETLDDKLILFKERRIYVTPVLSGPDANGNGQAFDPPREIASDTGCVSRTSVVKGPFGILFQSERGIYMLDRSLSISFIGEAIQTSIVGRTITSAVLVSGESEVRFCFEDNTAAVWNYRVNSWAIWNGMGGVHAVMWRGRHTRLGLDGDAEYEAAGTYGAPGTLPELSITTPWIKIAGLQGFKRVWRALILGDWYSGRVIVNVGYNYNDSFVDTHTWTEAEMAALPAMQLKITPSRQLCQSIRFRVREDVDPEHLETVGRGFVLQGLRLECGVRKGSFRHLGENAKG
jgi:hypothetical protein